MKNAEKQSYRFASTEERADFRLKEERQKAIKEFLIKNNILIEAGGLTQVDVKALKTSGLEYQNATRLSDGSKLSSLDAIDFLTTIKGVNKEQMTEDLNGESPVMTLPNSLDELQNGQYVRRADKALLQPWELGQKFKNWQKEIVLPDGAVVNFSEMALAKSLHDMRARRNEQGELEIYDKEKEKFIKFSGAAMKRLSGLGFGGAHENIAMNPLKFAKEHLKHLRELGLLKDEDFSTLAGSKTAELYGEHERTGLSPKNPYVYFSNSQGQGAKYYIGKNKISGLGRPINYETTSVKVLAPDLAGVLEKDKNGQKIIATLELASGDEMEKIRNRAAHKLRKDGSSVTKTKISQGSYFQEDYSKQHLKKYSITRFLPARSGEKPEDYFDRIRVLDNQEEVVKQLKQFSDLGVGVHNLPWSEQLMLCRIALEDKSPQRQERLKSFAKNYGVEGLRTFISLDYDQSLGNGILNIGEKLDSKLASMVFSKYGEIVDAAYKAKDYLTGHFNSEAAGQEDISRKLAENLLKKGKNLLSEFAKNNTQIESVSVMNKLDSLKTEILLYTGTFKVLKESGVEVKFAELEGTGLEVLDSLEIGEQDKQEMVRIFEQNRPDYSTELLKQTSEVFKKSLSEPGHEFTILKYEGHVVAFIRIDRLSHNKFYAGGLNVRPEARGNAVGGAMLEMVLNEKAKHGSIEAVAYSQNPMLKHYLNDYGFSMAGELPNYKGTGELFYKLERPQANAGAQRLNLEVAA